TIEHWYYNTFFPKYAKLATKLITVSNYTKQDIITQYNIDSKKIEVIYNAPSVGFKPISITEKKEIQNKFAYGQEYFCYVGALHPRKNIENLLLSFDVYKTKLKNNFKLIIVGRKAWKSKKIDEVFKNMTFAKDVIFTGRLNEEELNKVTASAFAMVYIPLFEGFGLPIVEAMACDVPIICSNVTSMPEVAGDAAILVSPNDINEISQAMINLTENTDLYQQKKLASAVRKKDFSWDIAAAKMWNTIEQTLEKQIE
ncbi:MAG: glycosyltransferase family 4 protein, partial [Bacteroidia bacterium]|nr:glycosyltransferase family 4 protein [Bacteroidia bacterium]